MDFMNIEEVRQACLAMHSAVEEGSPFADLGHPDIAFKIGGKIYAYLCVPDAPSCQHADTSNLLVLKSDPDVALDIRDKYPDTIEAAWHWNKKYWNQIHYDKLPPDLIINLIAESFRLVVEKLPKRIKIELGFQLP